MQNQSKITFVLSFLDPFSLSLFHFHSALSYYLSCLFSLYVLCCGLFFATLFSIHEFFCFFDFFACVSVCVSLWVISKSLCKITDLHFALTFSGCGNCHQHHHRYSSAGRHHAPHRSHMFKRSGQLINS